VLIGKLQGEARANAVMKAITKAKRRVTLSICGLGLMDESEALTLPGARAIDDDDVIEAVAEKQGAPLDTHWTKPEYPFATKAGGRMFNTASQWLEQWRRTVDACLATDALDKLKIAQEMNAGPIDTVASFDAEAAQEVREMLRSALDHNLPEPTEAGADDAEMEMPA
jgi:hypothetical protein